jgi:hypothetical protein
MKRKESERENQRYLSTMIPSEESTGLSLAREKTLGRISIDTRHIAAEEIRNYGKKIRNTGS